MFAIALRYIIYLKIFLKRNSANFSLVKLINNNYYIICVFMQMLNIFVKLMQLSMFVICNICLFRFESHGAWHLARMVGYVKCRRQLTYFRFLYRGCRALWDPDSGAHLPLSANLRPAPAPAPVRPDLIRWSYVIIVWSASLNFISFRTKHKPSARRYLHAQAWNQKLCSSNRKKKINKPSQLFGNMHGLFVTLVIFNTTLNIRIKSQLQILRNYIIQDILILRRTYLTFV